MSLFMLIIFSYGIIFFHSQIIFLKKSITSVIYLSKGIIIYESYRNSKKNR